MFVILGTQNETFIHNVIRFTLYLCADLNMHLPIFSSPFIDEQMYQYLPNQYLPNPTETAEILIKTHVILYIY